MALMLQLVGDTSSSLEGDLEASSDDGDSTRDDDTSSATRGHGRGRGRGRGRGQDGQGRAGVRGGRGSHWQMRGGQMLAPAVTCMCGQFQPASDIK